VWFIEHLKSETGHSTQKPIEAMRRPILNNSAPGEAVYEPFSGSGTTLIACEMEGRLCRAIELNPAYVDVGILRWQRFTGGEARLESTGQTFAEVQAERLEPSDRPAD
jgi:DNA modification methylase